MSQKIIILLCLLPLFYTQVSLGETQQIKKIKVQTVYFKEIAHYLNHTIGGAVPAHQDSKISAQISALIDHFLVDAGAYVKKGQTLLKLDCSENLLRLKQANAALNADKAQLEHAIFQFKQAKKLFKQGDVSGQDYHFRRSEQARLKGMLEGKKASLAIAKINVTRCQIKAPFEGYVTKRYANVGELTNVGSALLQLVSHYNHIVEVKLNHGLLNSFSTGKNHQFIVNNQHFPLKIESVLPVLNSTTRNHYARLSFTDKIATTGSIGKVQWQDSVLSVPPNYIVSRHNKRGIFIVQNNTAKFINVENSLEGQAVQLKLKGETQIISNGRYSVKQGDHLLIKNMHTKKNNP